VSGTSVTSTHFDRKAVHVLTLTTLDNLKTLSEAVEARSPHQHSSLPIGSLSDTLDGGEDLGRGK